MQVRIVDLAQFASVDKFAKELESEPGVRLDVLVCNSAVAPLGYESTVDGWELGSTLR